MFLSTVHSKLPFWGGALLCLSSLSCAAQAAPKPVPARKPSPKKTPIRKVPVPTKVKAAPAVAAPKGLAYLRGVNIMDLGIAGSTLPGIYGRNYTKPNLQALRDLKAQGLDVVRIPFLWERIQPRLDGELDAAYLGYMMDVLHDAATANLKVILDMHNYGRYTQTTTDERTARPFGDPLAPTEAQYADVWKRIAAAIKADPQASGAVYAYDLMNEPYNLPAVTGALTDVKTVSSFENGTGGWAVNAPHALGQTQRGERKTLALTVPAAEGSGKVFNTALPATVKKIAVDGGKTLQVQGFIPASTPGTVRARMWMTDATWKSHKTESTPIAKGETFTLNFTFDDEVWKDNRGIAIDFIVDKSDGSAPFVFNIDSVRQGNSGGAKTPPQVWEGYAQSAVSGLREAKDTTLIMVEGYDFSSSGKWPTNHPIAWIKDPLGKVMYHAHLYMDRDSSGTYKASHAEELELAKKEGYATVGSRTIARVKNFTSWVSAQRTQGFIGEFGWPNMQSVGKADSDAWDGDADEVLTFLDGNKTGLTVWGTGTWLRPTDNVLNAYQLPGLQGRDFMVLSPAVVLQRHPGK